MNKQPRIKTPTDSYVVHYPQFIEFADTQLEKCFWTSSEIAIEKDKQDLLINVTDAERHAITTALKLFVKYELFVGTEYWLSRVMNKFPRPEIQRMAAVFGMFELAVHAPFYNKLNEVLGLNTDEFYTSYVDDPVLASRMEFLESLVSSEDDLLSLGVFSMLEGCVLFSSFAMFKSFQSNGNNVISNTVRGISQSLLDEGLHQQAGAALFKQALKESKPSKDEKEALFSNLKSAAKMLVEHEDRISEKFFEKGSLRGYKLEDAKVFNRSRANICLSDLGVDAVFPTEPNPVADWFYASAQGYQAIDFFTGVGREYTRSWNEKEFLWSSQDA